MSDVRVSGLTIYPVKFRAGIDVDAVTVTETGFMYDRAWMLVESRKPKARSEEEARVPGVRRDRRRHPSRAPAAAEEAPGETEGERVRDAAHGAQARARAREAPPRFCRCRGTGSSRPTPR